MERYSGTLNGFARTLAIKTSWPFRHMIFVLASGRSGRHAKENVMHSKCALPALFAGLLLSSNALADQKEISPAACQPYTDTTLNPALLRVHEDGITNNYAVAKSVICPIPKDSEITWNPNYDSHIKVTFHRNGGSPLSANKCTLTVGYSANPPLTTTTRSVGVNNLTDGWLVFSGNDLYNASPEGPANLVCSIAPGNTLSFIYLYEEEATD